MKIFLLLISAFPLIAFAQLADVEPKHNRINFEPLVNNGIIKNAGILKEHIYTYSTRLNGAIDSTLTEDIFYDSLGYVVTKKEYSGKTCIQKNYHYTFNSNGLISFLRIETNQPKGKKHFTEIRYNNNGNEISKYDYDDNHENKIRLLKEYNKNQQCVFLKYLDDDNKAYTAKAYTYASNGNLAKTEIFIGTNVVGPVQTYLYKTENGKETVSLLINNTGAQTEVAWLNYNVAGQCTEVLLEEKRYKASSGSPVNDYTVTITNDRSQGVNNVPETYIASGNNISNLAVGNTLSQRTGAPEGAGAGNNILIEQVPQTGYTSTTSEFKGKYFFYNTDGTLYSEVSNADKNQKMVTKKHYYFR